MEQLGQYSPTFAKGGHKVHAVYHVRERHFISPWCKHPIVSSKDRTTHWFKNEWSLKIEISNLLSLSVFNTNKPQSKDSSMEQTLKAILNKNVLDTLVMRVKCESITSSKFITESKLHSTTWEKSNIFRLQHGMYHVK